MQNQLFWRNFIFNFISIKKSHTKSRRPLGVFTLSMVDDFFLAYFFNFYSLRYNILPVSHLSTPNMVLE